MSLPITATLCKNASELSLKKQELLNEATINEIAEDLVKKITIKCFEVAQTTIHQHYDWPIDCIDQKVLNYICLHLTELDYDCYIAESRDYLIVSWHNTRNF